MPLRLTSIVAVDVSCVVQPSLVLGKIIPPLFAHPFFFWALFPPNFSQGIIFPQIPSFWDLRSTLSSTEKATCRGWVFGDGSGRGCLPGQKEIPFSLRMKKVSHRMACRHQSRMDDLYPLRGKAKHRQGQAFPSRRCPGQTRPMRGTHQLDKFQSAPKERRRRRAEKWLSKRVSLESPFLLCPPSVFRTSQGV